MFFGKKLIVSLPLLINFILMLGLVEAKSVYVISNTETSQLQAYEIQDANLVHQTDYFCKSDPYDDTGAVGLAIDESEYGQFLFVTFEGENDIELVNAKAMQYIDVIQAPQANNLAGIVVDQTKGKVYTVDRGTDHLYSYTWDPINKTLIPDFNDPYYVQLEDISHEPGEGAYGLAFDYENDRLYVADNTTTVKCYDANDPNWSKLNNFCFTITDKAVGIAIDAIDVDNQYVYTGSSQFGGSTYYITKYDLAGHTETRVNVGSPVLGIAVDQDTSLVYITTYSGGTNPNRLIIYDSNLVKQPWESGDIGNPAGVAVSQVQYKPPLLHIEKTATIENGCPYVSPDDPNRDEITYYICYHASGHDVNNVKIVDYLPPEVDFNSADPNGNYDSDSNTVTWDLNDLSPADSGCVWFKVKANALVEPNGIITNFCEMESDSTYNFAYYTIPHVLYVDANASGGDGTSWENAYTDLQDALERAGRGSEIWVAEGTYTPTTSTSDYYANFALVEGVAIYGGFDGNETSLNQRNWLTNETILTGDVGDNGSADVGTVVSASSVSQTAIVDGFTITKGYEYGIHCKNASPTIKHNKIKDNYPSANVGDGMYCENNSSANIIKCEILNNGRYGIYSKLSNLNITDCNINGSANSDHGIDCRNNSSITITGSKIQNNRLDGIDCEDGLVITIKNNWIYNNGTSGSGSGICFSGSLSSGLVRNNTIANNTDYGIERNSSTDPNITNCILWGNGDDLYNCSATYSCIEDCNDAGGVGNICGKANDPQFVAPDANNFHLDPNVPSPCIDAGDPNFVPELSEKDIDGDPRISDGDRDGNDCIDMGADEADCFPKCDPNYIEWVNLGKPHCWCYPRQCHGDCDNHQDGNPKSGYYYVWGGDLNMVIAGWQQPYGGDPDVDTWICADFTHYAAGNPKSGYFRVLGDDLNVVIANWKTNPPANCLKCSREKQGGSPGKDYSIEEMIKWLEELWETNEYLRKLISEDAWQKFMELLQEQI